MQINEPIQLPKSLQDIPSGEWMPIHDSDPAAGYITGSLWDKEMGVPAWEAARFSKAVYLYREMRTRWTVIVKYYAPKTGQKAEKHASRELSCIQRVHSIGLSSGSLRAIQALDAWRGILFLEYIEGLTLADAVAVRQSRPGELVIGIKQVSALLARLHSATLSQDLEIPPTRAVDETIKYIDELERWGILEQESDIAASLRFATRNWSERLFIPQNVAALTHGDATTTNFILPPDGGAVAIDWERMAPRDAAFDIGRLAAEVSHTIRQQGGRGTEVAYLIDHIYETYLRERPAISDTQSFIGRVRFYRASSLLRIARNGWVSRQDRMGLVAEALSLLVR